MTAESPTGGVPGPVRFPAPWIHGSRRRGGPPDPPLQVQPYDAATRVLRQSKDVTFEAPFLFLFFGRDRALLLDTGATADPARCPLRLTVDRLVEEWRRSHPSARYPLVVAHSHGHGDHVAGDVQFADRPDTEVVGREAESVRAFFGLAGGPDEIVRFDLGGRVLEVMAIPGHQAASIAVYDPGTGFLLTGDTVCPGRLYVRDMPAFVASLERLVAFARRRPVSAVMGCHIEMTRTPGRDYPVGTRYQPDERDLAMTVDQLGAVRDAAVAVASRPGVHRFDDFLVFNGRCRAGVSVQLLRGWATNLRHRVTGA